MKKYKFIPLIIRGESCKIALDEICYIYRSTRKLMFETDGGLKHTYDKLDDIEPFLSPEFFRCMVGCSINLSRIYDMKDLIVFFDNGKIFRPGKETYLKIKRKYNEYLLHLLYQSKEDDDDDD